LAFSFDKEKKFFEKVKKHLHFVLNYSTFWKTYFQPLVFYMNVDILAKKKNCSIVARLF